MTSEDLQLLTERFAGILAPISAGNPVGVDLRVTPGWTLLRESRIGDHAGTLDVGAQPVALPDWKEAAALASQALERRTKDLQIAVWLIEALTHIEGFEGLHGGLFIAVQLIQRYKHELFPRDPDDQDIHEDSVKQNLLDWFRYHLPDWIATIGLGPILDGVPFSLDKFLSLEMAARESYRREETSEVYSQLEEAAQRVWSREYEILLSLIAPIREQLTALTAAAAEIGCSVDFWRVDEVLTSCERLLARWRGSVPAEQPLLPETDTPIPQPQADGSPEAITDDWQRAMAWIRSERLDLAAGPIEAAFSAARAERDRFLLKIDLAQALVDIKRYEAAVKILEPMNEQVERFHLQEWEAPDLPLRVWKLLHSCYRANLSRGLFNMEQDREKLTALESQFCRTAPWLTFR